MTKEELNNLSTEELIKLKEKHESISAIKDSEQMAFKILINSAYGAVGNAGFRFFNREMARSITMSGQSAIKWSSKVANAFLNETFNTTNKDYTIYSDTDSIYLNLDLLYKKILEKKPDISRDDMIDMVDKFCNIIQKKLSESYDVLFARMNGFNNHLEMKREAIASAVFYMKKKYVMLVFDDEGFRYQNPEIKILGLEAVRSSTPEWARDKIKETFKQMFFKSKDDMIEYIEKVRNEFNSLSYTDIALPTGVNGIDAYQTDTLYVKGTPAHVKASIHHNILLEKLGLEDKYEAIKNGDKVKILTLKTPNTVGNDRIAFTDNLPSEFGLEKYVDRDGQFAKIYLDPVKRIFDVIGYDTERKNSSEDFF